MRFCRLTMLAVVLPMALSGCGVPDLVAHGIKKYDESRAAQAAPPPASNTVPVRNGSASTEPPPVEQSASPQRESVSVETLPSK